MVLLLLIEVELSYLVLLKEVDVYNLAALKASVLWRREQQKVKLYIFTFDNFPLSTLNV